MSSYRWIWFVLLAGLMLSLPQSNASAASISLRPQGPTTFEVGKTLVVDVYLLLDEADQVATIEAVTMQLTGGMGLVSVACGLSPFAPGNPCSTTGSVFQHPPSIVNTNTAVFPGPDFIAFALFGAVVDTPEAFLASLTLTGAIEGSYDLVALRSSPGPPIFSSPAGDNLFDLLSDESLRLTVGVIPEPGTLVLLGASLAGLAFLRRRAA